LWATRVEELYTLYVFRPTPAGALAWFRWSAGPRARQWLRRFKFGRASAADVSKPREQVSHA